MPDDRKSSRSTRAACTKGDFRDYYKGKRLLYEKVRRLYHSQFYGRVRPSNIWTRGVYYEGLMSLYSIYPREDYYRYAYDWADFHKWGMRNGNTTRNADDHCCGQTYIDLYNICPSDPNMIRNIKASIDMVVNTPQVNDWWWIDAVQMAMPIFAKFGKMTGEQKYYDKMWDMYYYTRSQHDETGMFNQKDGLWWRDQDFNPPYKEPNGEDCYWSRGNGWVYAALVRVLDEIPADEKHRQDYINDFLAMSKALKSASAKTASGMSAFMTLRTLAGKRLSARHCLCTEWFGEFATDCSTAKEYLPIALKAWNAMVKDAVHPNGFLGYVQGTGKGAQRRATGYL